MTEGLRRALARLGHPDQLPWSPSGRSWGSRTPGTISRSTCELRIGPHHSQMSRTTAPTIQQRSRGKGVSGVSMSPRRSSFSFSASTGSQRGSPLASAILPQSSVGPGPSPRCARYVALDPRAQPWRGCPQPEPRPKPFLAHRVHMANAQRHFLLALVAAPRCQAHGLDPCSDGESSSELFVDTAGAANEGFSIANTFQFAGRQKSRRAATSPQADPQTPAYRCPGHARTTTAPAGSSLIT